MPPVVVNSLAHNKMRMLMRLRFYIDILDDHASQNLKILCISQHLNSLQPVQRTLYFPYLTLYRVGEDNKFYIIYNVYAKTMDPPIRF